MRNRRVGQQPAQAGLRQRPKIAEQQRGRRDERHHRQPAGQPGTHGGQPESRPKQTDQQREARELRGRSHQRRRHGRCTLVNIRRPKMERSRRHFETERRQNHHQRHGEQRGQTRAGQTGRDGRKFDRASQPVKQAEPEQEKCGGDAPQQEIFQARLRRLRPGPVKPRQHVKREARELEREEGQQELLRHSHHQQARRRQQHKRDKLRRMPQACRAARQRQGHTRQHQNSRPRSGAQRIEHEAAPGGRSRRAHAPHQRQGHQHRAATNHRRRAPACRGGPVPGPGEIERQHRQCTRHQRRLARQRLRQSWNVRGHEPPPFNTD